MQPKVGGDDAGKRDLDGLDAEVSFAADGKGTGAERDGRSKARLRPSEARGEHLTSLVAVVVGRLLAHEDEGRIDAGDADPFYPAKITTARFFADHVMAMAPGLAREVIQGGASTLELDEALF